MYKDMCAIFASDTAYAKNKATKKWYNFDDSHVSETFEERLVVSATIVHSQYTHTYICNRCLSVSIFILHLFPSFTCFHPSHVNCFQLSHVSILHMFSSFTYHISPSFMFPSFTFHHSHCSLRLLMCCSMREGVQCVMFQSLTAH